MADAKEGVDVDAMETAVQEDVSFSSAIHKAESHKLKHPVDV